MPITSPDVRSTPLSQSVYEFDAKTSFANLPLQPSFSGEYAASVNNPNIYGNALIDNMESIKQVDTMPTDYLSWHPSANPGGDVTYNQAMVWSNTSVKSGAINPATPSTESDTSKQVLSVSYKLLPNKEASIVYPISKIGVDYTKKLFLDFWMYSDGVTNDDITLALGSLNEDFDNTGILSTEDKNSDGILNPNEDIGIPFNHPDGVEIIGANNGRN